MIKNSGQERKNIALVQKLLYDVEEIQEEEEIDIEIDPVEALKAAISGVGLTQNEAAEKANWTKQSLSAKMVNRTFKAKDWLHLLDSIGVDVKLFNRETGTEIRPILNLKGRGERVRGVSEGVRYDTEYSDCLSSNLYADGVNKYTDGVAEELYVDISNRYFMVVYTDDGNTKIRAVSPNIAKAFIETYGPVEAEE